MGCDYVHSYLTYLTEAATHCLQLKGLHNCMVISTYEKLVKKIQELNSIYYYIIIIFYPASLALSLGDYFTKGTVLQRILDDVQIVEEKVYIFRLRKKHFWCSCAW